MKNKSQLLLFLVLSITCFSCKNKESYGEAEMGENYDDDSLVIEVVEPVTFEKLDEKAKNLAGALIPSMAKYEYTFPKEWIEESKKINWDSLGYNNNIPNQFFSQSANLHFIGSDFSEITNNNAYGEGDGSLYSSVYQSNFINKKIESDGAKYSVRVDLLRIPHTGKPLIAINGKALNYDSIQFSVDHNKKQIDYSIRCQRKNPILDLKSPNSTDENKLVSRKSIFYETNDPFIWRQYRGESIAEPNDSFLYVNMTFIKMDKPEPICRIDFDGERLVVAAMEEDQELSFMDVDEIQKIYFNNNYIHHVVGNNVVIDPSSSQAIQNSIVMSNMGAYGKSEVAAEKFRFGRIIDCDGDNFGTIFKGKRNKNGGYTIYFFRGGDPKSISNVQKIYLEGSNEMIEITTPRGQTAHLKIEGK